jgi:hypothetical protein
MLAQRPKTIATKKAEQDGFIDVPEELWDSFNPFFNGTKQQATSTQIGLRIRNLLLGSGLGGSGGGGNGASGSRSRLLGLGLSSLWRFNLLLNGRSSLGVHARDAGVALLLALGATSLGLGLKLLLANHLSLGLVDVLDKETLVLEHATLALHVEVVVPGAAA